MLLIGCGSVLNLDKNIIKTSLVQTCVGSIEQIYEKDSISQGQGIKLIF